MKLQEYINTHLDKSGESPDSLAGRARIGRASVFRAKGGEDVRYSTMQQIVDAVGEPLTLLPGEELTVENRRGRADGQV